MNIFNFIKCYLYSEIILHYYFSCLYTVEKNTARRLNFQNGYIAKVPYFEAPGQEQQQIRFFAIGMNTGSVKILFPTSSYLSNVLGF